MGTLVHVGPISRAHHGGDGESGFGFPSRTRNRNAASTQMTAALGSTGGYPKRASATPATAAALACPAKDTRKFRADALLRSPMGTRSISNVNIPGSLMYWADIKAQ